MSAERGFSLIEVLVALAIVGFALAAGAATIGNGAIGHQASSDAGTALALAEQKLTEAGITGVLKEGHGEGSFGDRFDWSLTIAPYDDPAEDRTAKPDAKLRLFRVAVSVAWEDGRRRRQLALSTLRLAPAQPP